MAQGFTAAGYPKRRSPRARYRRPHHIQDTVLLEVEVPAAAIPWLEHFARFLGGPVEKTAFWMLAHAMRQEQEAMHRDDGRCVHGGKRAADAVMGRVHAFLAEPVNCGPGARDAKRFLKEIAEIHGSSEPPSPAASSDTEPTLP